MMMVILIVDGELMDIIEMMVDIIIIIIIIIQYYTIFAGL